MPQPEAPSTRGLFQGLVGEVVDRHEDVARVNADLLTERLSEALDRRPEIAEVVTLVAHQATLSTIGALIEAGELSARFNTAATEDALRSRADQVQRGDF